jgi:wobble nucleotide-excising tRNase
MLERFDYIRKVGLFNDYSHEAGHDFGAVTIVFGENGVGKSTLAAILDALRENSCAEIIRRIRLPGDTVPTVAVCVNNKVYSFGGGNWDAELPYSTLEVFFPGFISRNVHAATTVESDHRRNLCEFVLGRTAVQKVARLAEADNDGRAALAEIRSIEKQIQLVVKSPDTLQTFLGLGNDPEIDQKIEKVRLELKQSQSRDAILSRAIPTVVTLPVIDRNSIAGLLQTTAQGVGSDLASVVRAHVKDHLDENGEQWLEYGARHAGVDKPCPFCGQEIIAPALVAAISAYFSTEYRRFLETTVQSIERVGEQLGTAAFQRMKAAFAAQLAVAAQWTEDAAIDQASFSASLGSAELIWLSAAKKLGSVLAAKKASPLDGINPDLADEALEDYGRALVILIELNGILVASGKAAQDRKTALSKADTAEIQARLNRLENQKVRFEPFAQELLSKRNGHIQKRSDIDDEKAKLKNEIEDHASRVVGKYQAGINYYLQHFGCDVRIDSVQSKFPSGKASVHYVLKAHGHEIELGCSTDSPCFETILSEGDKYTLALSFFLARLKDEASLSGRIVVLDDPVNSLGSVRRDLIGGVIRDLHIRGAQIIVLTHDEHLAAFMWRDTKLGKSMVALQVQKTNRGSGLQPWDIEHAMRTEYVKHYLALQAFLENGGDHEGVARCIRPYLEQRLRHCFPGPPFQDRDSLGKLIERIRQSQPGTRLYALVGKLPELEAINTGSLPSHHATDDVPNLSPLTPQGVRLYAEKALSVI